MAERPKHSQGRAVGIDLGTTLSKLACIDDSGRPVLIPNAEGELLTPSIVAFTRSAILVGRDAKRESLANPARAVMHVKRQMGNPTWRFKIDDETYTPETISALILKKVKQDAEMHIGPIHQAVITVPAYFDDARRKATEDAGVIAGLEVLDIINEPTASALAYGLARAEDDGTFLVYDLGGGTFDVTVIDKKGNEFITLATDGDVQLGGKDWDERLVNHLADKFRQEFKLNIREDPQAMAYLYVSAEEAKKTLSRRDKTTVPVSYKGQWGNYEVAVQEFESLTEDLLAVTQLTTEMVLEEAGITWAGVKRIIPTGGSARMPMVQRLLERMAGKPVQTDVPVDETVAAGAAIHAAICAMKTGDRIREYGAEAAERLGKVRTIDVAAHALGLIIKDVRTLQYRNDVLIPKNSRLPASVTKTYQTASEGQQTIVLQVVQGDAPDPVANITIGMLEVTGLPPARPTGVLVDVTYSYDRKGRIHVTAKDQQTGTVVAAEITRQAGLRPEQVAEEVRRLSLKSVE
ncbi:MAG: Hsp70 family protein [Planctomycetota bacterium]|nr:Hsp70 family protein [Planctomycetota bacterium]